MAIIDIGSGDDEDGDDGGGEPAGVGAFAPGNSPNRRSTPTPRITTQAASRACLELTWFEAQCIACPGGASICSVRAIAGRKSITVAQRQRSLASGAVRCDASPSLASCLHFEADATQQAASLLNPEFALEAQIDGWRFVAKERVLRDDARGNKHDAATTPVTTRMKPCSYVTRFR